MGVIIMIGVEKRWGWWTCCWDNQGHGHTTTAAHCSTSSSMYSGRVQSIANKFQ